MTKVVINVQYGGFGLSNDAFEELMTRKGVEFETSPASQSFRGKDVDYWRKGHVGEDEHYLWYWQFAEDRSDADLVAVVEKFGDGANSWCSKLKVVEIPDNVEWEVCEYDGNEWVAEKHRTWS